MRYIKVATAPTEAPAIIDDNETSVAKTWSSNKIQSQITDSNSISTWNVIKTIGNFSIYPLKEEYIAISCTLTSANVSIGKISDYININKNCKIIEFNAIFETNASLGASGYRLVANGIVNCYIVDGNIYASQHLSSQSLSGFIKIHIKYLETVTN